MAKQLSFDERTANLVERIKQDFGPDGEAFWCANCGASNLAKFEVRRRAFGAEVITECADCACRETTWIALAKEETKKPKTRLQKIQETHGKET